MPGRSALRPAGLVLLSAAFFPGYAQKPASAQLAGKLHFLVGGNGRRRAVTVHNALGVISYDEKAQLYRFRTCEATRLGVP